MMSFEEEIKCQHEDHSTYTTTITTAATSHGAKELAEAVGSCVGVNVYPMKGQDVEVIQGPQAFYDNLCHLIQVNTTTTAATTTATTTTTTTTTTTCMVPAVDTKLVD